MATHLTQTEPPLHPAHPEAEQIDILTTHLQRNYPVMPAAIQVVRSPLRICPLGAHIDHQLGLVTGMTIDRPVLMAFAPTTDGAVQVESLNFDPPLAFDLSNVPPYQPGDWGNYIRGAVLALQRRHKITHGLVGVIAGAMPIGGLSSSAAATIAYLLALETVNRLEISPETNVSLVRFTENQYIGLNNGILDQSVILFNRHNQLTLIDCQSVQIDNIPTTFQVEDYEILVVYSGISRTLVNTDYNNRVAECQQAARLLLEYTGQPAGAEAYLRQISPNIFNAEGHRLPAAPKKRAAHYFGEMQRVSEGVAAWRARDIKQFGALITQSGQSSIENYECGSPQLITLYEILRETSGVYGARFSGAGFRGCCIALIDPAARETIAEAIHCRYPVAHPGAAEHYSIHFCRPDDRAGLMTWRD